MHFLGRKLCQLPAELRELIAAWPLLPEEVRAGVFHKVWEAIERE